MIVCKYYLYQPKASSSAKSCCLSNSVYCLHTWIVSLLMCLPLIFPGHQHWRACIGQVYGVSCCKLRMGHWEGCTLPTDCPSAQRVQSPRTQEEHSRHCSVRARDPHIPHPELIQQPWSDWHQALLSSRLHPDPLRGFNRTWASEEASLGNCILSCMVYRILTHSEYRMRLF